MAKKRVYVESSVISYLTARPPRDMRRRVRQDITIEWWEKREKWALFLSSVVLEEIAGGDSFAAEQRLVTAQGLPVLPDHPQTKALVDKLIAGAAIPSKAHADAAHLALAALHGMDYLATWNQTHLDNPDLRHKIAEIITGQGLTPTAVLTPERLLEMDYDE